MDPGPYETRDGAVRVRVKVVPGASRSRVMGRLGDRLKVAVAAPPERGAANAELCRVLAARLGRRPGDLHVVAGSTSPQKTVEVPAADLDEVRRRLEDNGPP